MGSEIIKVSHIALRLGERVVKQVAIVGGTHGNERIGVELVDLWSKNNVEIKRSTFNSMVLLGNPSAVDLNVR